MTAEEARGPMTLMDLLKVCEDKALEENELYVADRIRTAIAHVALRETATTRVWGDSGADGGWYGLAYLYNYMIP